MDVMDILELQHCSELMVGRLTIRGLSVYGEKKD
jgi:hypothetical protein